MKLGAVEGNAVQLQCSGCSCSLGVPREQLQPCLQLRCGCASGTTSSTLCQLLWALCCTADTAGTYHTPLLATVPTGVWSTGQMGISGSESFMWLPCLPWASSYCFEHLTCFSLEGLLIFFLPKLGLPTWIFLPLKCCCEKSVCKGTEFITPHKLQSCGSPFFFELCLWTCSAHCTTCRQQTHSAPLEIQLFCPLYC